MRSPLGFECCVGCADGGAVAAFEEEGWAQVRVRRVFAADFCDLFGSQVALGEHPQGDRSFNLRGAHAVCVGELARGFDPRTHDAAAVVLLVVLVVAVGEVVSINGERLVVGGSGGTSWEDGRSVDGDMCAVGEGDGVAGRAGGVRVGDLLACEQCVEVSGTSLGGVTVNDVEHVCFLLRGRVFFILFTAPARLRGELPGVYMTVWFSCYWLYSWYWLYFFCGGDALAKNQTYKAFVARPTHVLNLNGELLDNVPVMAELASEVRDISAYAIYTVRNDEALGDELARVTASAPAEAGRQAGITMPEFLASGRTGRSRKEKLFQYNVVASFRSYVEASLYAQPGMIDRDVSACVEEGDVLVFESDPRAAPVLFAVSRPMWKGALVSPLGWREFVVAAGSCGCQRRRVEVATVATRELLHGGRA